MSAEGMITCPRCRGSGKWFGKNCPFCRGKGFGPEDRLRANQTCYDEWVKFIRSQFSEEQSDIVIKDLA